MKEILTSSPKAVIKRTQERLRTTAGYLEAIITTVREPFLLLSEDLRIRSASLSFYENFRCSPEEAENQLLYDLGNEQWNIPELRALLEEILPARRLVENFKIEHDFPSIGRKTLCLNARHLRGEEGKSELILLAIEDISGHRRGQERSAAILAREQALQLHESERRYRQLIQSLPAAIYTCDTEGRVMLYNEAAAALWGREPEIGKDLWCEPWRVYRPDGSPLPLENCPMAVCIREGRPVRNVEIVIERPDGTQINVLPHPTPLFDVCGTMVGAVNLLVDLTERHRAHETQARLAAIVESSNDAIISKNLRGVVQSWNAGAERIFGYRAEEMIGQPITRIIPPHLQSEEKHILGKLSRGERIEHYETTRIAKDGRLIDVSLTVSPIRDATGRIIGASKIARDVTLQSRAYEAQVRLAAIVESSDDAIISKSLQGVIESWNKGAELIFGYSAKEMIGQPITRIIPPHLQNEEKDILWKLTRAERIVHYETVRLAKDGRLINVSLTVSPIHDVAGRIIGASKVARDITRQKRTEKALVDADRRKNEFLAMLAHELRNPLDAISNAVRLLNTTDREEQQSRGRDIIERQAMQLTRLVDELLDVSRITQGKIHLQKEPVETSEVIGRAVETVQPLMKERGHELRVSNTEEPLWLTADPARLEQILVNLLTNAGKYTEPGGCIAVTATREGATLVITVHDNGIGMSANTLSQAFELFAQNAPTLDRSDSGLGIGLTLVKTLTEMHGGSIEARSDGPGRGSEFTLRLPLGKTAGTPPNLEDRTAAPVFEPSRRVLIVDDNRDSADVLSQLLKIMGHQVQTVYDGLTALGTAAAFHPDAVLLDIGLPGLNGYEVAKRLRREPKFQDTLLIAVSGYCQEADRKRSREAGFDHHLAKPIDHETLANLLTEPDTAKQAH